MICRVCRSLITQRRAFALIMVLGVVDSPIISSKTRP